MKRDILMELLILDRLEGLLRPLTSFFRNISWTAADIDMKLEIPPDTTIRTLNEFNVMLYA